MRRSIRTLLTWFCVALSWAAGAEQATAQKTYRFINIADSNGPLNRFGPEFSINNHGTVAFNAYEVGRNAHGVFAGNGGHISTIGHTNGPYSSFHDFIGTDINDSGMVAFNASLDGGGSGVFASNGVTTVTIAQAGRLNDFSFVRGKPAIDQEGAVAFIGSKVGTGEGIYIGDGSQTTLAALGRAMSFGPHHPSVSLVDGFVSFIDQQSRILEAKDGVTDIIIEPGVTVDFGPSRWPLGRIYTHDRNSDGVTAFIGDPGELGIYTVKDGVVTRVTDHLSTVSPAGYESIAINDDGVVAFLGSVDRWAIFTGGKAMDEVVGVGDPLFGSTFSYLQQYVDVNNRGDVAFAYSLANGIYGIAVARVVPEPGGVAIVVVALAMFVIRAPGARRPGSLGWVR